MPSFEIVELDEKGKPRPFPAGVFPDGATAASVLSSLKLRFPDKKLQPRPLIEQTNDWRAREQRRFDEGVYTPIGWDLSPIKDHFAYRALKVPSNIAFTYNVTEGTADKQRSFHVNTYLLSFYPHLSVQERRKYVWDFTGVDPGDILHITQDAEEIKTVYMNGPESCMTHDLSDYDSYPFHPAEVYAGPDLAIAYLKEENRYTARCVVWPEKKIWGRMYGDDYKLGEALKEAGYREYDNNHDFNGARITLIKTDDDDIVCPYMDMTPMGHIHDGVFTVGSYNFVKDLRDKVGGQIYTCQDTAGVCYNYDYD